MNKLKKLGAISKLYVGFILLVMVGCSEDTVDFEPTGTITGSVISSIDQEALSNVEISTNPSSSTVFTDSNGDFVINNVLAGSYAVQADAGGFETAFESVTVTGDNISSVAFQLQPSQDDNLSPTAPILVFPEDGADDVELEVVLEWDAFDPEGDELEFIVELRNGTTSEIEMFEVVGDSTLTVTNLNLSTSYFWQVIASDGNNAQVSSSISVFTTLESPSNPLLFVREMSGNNVIFSGNELEGSVDVSTFQLTQETSNSFRPIKNNAINRIAFLRTVSGESQLFTMDLAGEDITQLTGAIPVQGFRQESLRYTWYNDGQQLLYPSFNRLMTVNNDGSGTSILYETTDGSIISEVATPDFDEDLVVLKTNNVLGYDVRIFTVRLSTGMEETIILEDVNGAAGGIDISASGNEILYFRDISGSQNNQYRIFEGRLFIYNISEDITLAIDTGTNTGQNELGASFLPNEGGVLFTRVGNNIGATPGVFVQTFDNTVDQSTQLFTNAFMSNWE